MVTKKKATKKTAATRNGRMKVTLAEAPETATRKKTTHLVVPAPNLRTVTFAIVGTAPYVQNKFSARIRQEYREKQMEGTRARSRKDRKPKDFEKLFQEAIHVSKEGWYGIPAPAFRAAMIDACRLIGFKMTVAKLSVFVLADGLDKDDKTPLVRIYGDPVHHEAVVRNATGVIDLRARPMWEEWRAEVRIQFDGDQFDEQDVANLLMRAGLQCGIGEGRPNSKQSFGQGWGTFTVADK